MRYATKTKHNLSALLMAPIQRVTRYPLLLNDINKDITKAKKAADTEGLTLTDEQEKKAIYMQEAYALSLDLCNYVNDMMEAGRILGYPVSDIC